MNSKKLKNCTVNKIQCCHAHHLNHYLTGLGMVYVATGNKDGATRQYNFLRNLNADAAADLLRAVPK